MLLALALARKGDKIAGVRQILLRFYLHSYLHSKCIQKHFFSSNLCKFAVFFWQIFGLSRTKKTLISRFNLLIISVSFCQSG